MTTRGVFLAFDVSTPVGTVAVGRGREVLASGLLLRPREHAAQLLPQIAETLREAGAEGRDLAGVVVGRGPGSFTGVRIAAATARGLSAGWGVPVWPRSSLAAAAASDGARIPAPVAAPAGFQPVILPEGAERRPRYVLFDARGDRVYAACYRFMAGGMETLVAPRADTLPQILDSELPEDVLFYGDGALRHAGALERAGLPVMPFPAGLPTAEGLLEVHSHHPTDAPSSLEARWEPDYLRGSSARPAWRHRPDQA